MYTMSKCMPVNKCVLFIQPCIKKYFHINREIIFVRIISSHLQPFVINISLTQELAL